LLLWLVALAAMAPWKAHGGGPLPPSSSSPEDLPRVILSRPPAGFTPTLAMSWQIGHEAASPTLAERLRLGLDFAVGMSIAGWFDVSAVLPLRLDFAGEPSGTVGGVRLGARLAIPGARRKPRATGGGIALLFAVDLPAAGGGDLPAAGGGDARPTYRPGFVFDEQLNRWLLLAINLGTAIRPATDAQPLDLRFTAAAAAIVSIVPDAGISAFTGIEGDAPIVPLASDGSQVRADLFLGARWLSQCGFGIALSGGAEVRDFGSTSFFTNLMLTWIPARSAEGRARRVPTEPSPIFNPGCPEESDNEAGDAGVEDGARPPAPEGAAVTTPGAGHLLAAPPPSRPSPLPRAKRSRVNQGSGTNNPCPPSMTVEQVAADVWAGALIALRTTAGDLRFDVKRTRARDLVWSKRKLFGKHTFDWNPALDHLAAVLDEDVDAWITKALSAAAAAHNEKDRGHQRDLLVDIAADVARIGRVMAGGRGPVNVGKAGEAAAGITGPKTRIYSSKFTTHYRVPDRLTDFTIEEVKNVLKLSNIRQLREYLDYARDTGRTFVLYVRPTTKLCKELQRLIGDGDIIRKFI
jgi:hypothetical protein